MTLAQYIYKRMAEDQITFQRDRAKAWPSGLFVTADDIRRYIEEYESEVDLDDWRKGSIWEKRLVEKDNS